MKLPVLEKFANASALVKIADGTDENGVMNVSREIDVKARFEQSNSVTYTKEGTKVTLRGKLFVFEKLELFPDNAMGFCIINGFVYDIANTSKKLNPDNSVHHIVLELI